MFIRVLLSAALAAGFAAAQGGMGDEGGMGGGMGGRGGGGRGGANGGMESGAMPRAQRQTPAEMFMDKLKLKSEQKDEVIKILSETAQKMRPMAEQMNRGRQIIGQAILSNKSEEELKPMMDEFTKLYAQMNTLEADAFAKIYAGLKPNQQKNAPQAFELIDAILMPQMAGGSRGMGRGQGGNRGEGGRN